MARSRSRPLIITAEAYDAMIAHCTKGSALACCGILAGVPPTASVAYPLRNAASSRVRYVSDPRDLFRASVDLRDRGLEIVAIYHFYPQTAAIPPRLTCGTTTMPTNRRSSSPSASGPRSGSGGSPGGTAKS